MGEVSARPVAAGALDCPVPVHGKRATDEKDLQECSEAKHDLEDDENPDDFDESRDSEDCNVKI